MYRFGNNGLLDSSFGANGVFEWSNGANSQARSLALEPDGRIVVAGVGYFEVGGETEGALVVLRLLVNGSLDNTFGEDGVYVGPVVNYFGQVRLTRTSSGGYRVSAAVAEGCAIVGLTAAGVLDVAFGDAGIAPVSSAGGLPVHCESLKLLSDDKLLVAGGDPESVFASRLLANGARDPAFTADAAIADSMTGATSIIAAGDGKVLVAGLRARRCVDHAPAGIRRA